MKKLITTLLMATAIMSSTFAQGFTQYDLAELLLNKAIAENLIDKQAYTEDEVISFVAENNLFEVSDQTAEVSVEVVRQALADYEANKGLIGNQVIDPTVSVDELAYEALEAQDRKLTHEFMQTTYEERNFTDEIGRFEPLDGESFVTTDDDVYPLMNKYRYELYRIFGWYAKEYNLYVDQSPASVGLYADEASVASQSTPLIEFGFMPDQFALSDGIYYSVRMQTGHLYNVKYQGESLAKYREKIVATGFKQDHLVLALKDALALFIQDEVELNKFVDTYVADVVENEDKVYSYDKDRYEIFDGYKVFISKNTGSVFYHIDYDLTQWGTK
jgi:hypothetical protein